MISTFDIFSCKHKNKIKGIWTEKNGIARQIAEMIPECKIYCEPFAGTAKVYQELSKRVDAKYDTAVLNDTSKFVRKWLRATFSDPIVTSVDFMQCVKNLDSKNTVFVFDQPWNKSYYMQKFSSFNRESVEQYDLDVLLLCKTLKGKFIITTRKENTRMLRSGFKHLLVESEYVVSGKYPKVLVTTNIKGIGAK